MNNKKNIVLFVNDSYFSHLLSKDLIESYHDKISLVVFSKSTSSSIKKIFSIYKKVSINYFIYRVFIQVLSKTFYRKKTVEFFADQYEIEKCYVKKRSDLLAVINKNSNVAFAFNFDIIIKNDILSKFEYGIYNIHASKLPNDKGISPVLWSFARGDKYVWSTIYKMDEGIDSGPILKQFQINVKEDDTSFSLYRRVCTESGYALNELVKKILKNQIELVNQPRLLTANYFSWPDKRFSSMMKDSNRNFIKIKDFLN
jgi:methionyl-tRNA formyltransferase